MSKHASQVFAFASHSSSFHAKKQSSEARRIYIIVMRLDFSFFSFFYAPLCCPSFYRLRNNTCVKIKHNIVFLLKDELSNRSIVDSLFLSECFFGRQTNKKDVNMGAENICKYFNIRCHISMRYFIFFFMTLTKLF
jgi:hypothetical protein